MLGQDLSLPDVTSLYNNKKRLHPLNLLHELFPFIFSKDELDRRPSLEGRTRGELAL